jgi:hypothetical protein
MLGWVIWMYNGQPRGDQYQPNYYQPPREYYHPPAPPPPYMAPRRKKGGLIILIIGLVILIIGLVLAIFFLTYDKYEDYEKPEDVVEKIMNDEYKEGETIKMIGEVESTDTENGEDVLYIKGFEIDIGGDPLKLPVKNDVGAKKGDTVAVKANVGDEDIDVEIVDEYANIFGIITGVVILIIGLIMIIFGAKKFNRDRPAYRMPPPQYGPPLQQPPQYPGL